MKNHSCQTTITGTNGFVEKNLRRIFNEKKTPFVLQEEILKAIN